MEFEWDDNKNQANINKHGISFEQAQRIFEGFTLDFIDECRGHNEVREISIGAIDGFAVLVVVHTDRCGTCRNISARPALKSEKVRYEKALRKAFDL